MIRSAALAAALMTTAAGLAGSPATAAPSPPACATGAITAYSAGLSWFGTPTVSVTGWIQPCALGPRPSTFDITYYGEERGTVSPDRVRSFGPATGPTSFTTSATYDSFTTSSGAVYTTELPLAICVGLRGPAPVACVQVTTAATDRPPLVAPLPIDSTMSLFQKPVTITFNPNDPHTNPGCGNCV